MRCLTPETGEPLLRTAHELTVENDGIADTLTLTRGVLRAEVIREICVHLEPYQTGEKPITGETVIAKDLTIDSLAIMDMVMELEDRFDVSIPMSVIAEIHTVDELADTIQDLSAQALVPHMGLFDRHAGLLEAYRDVRTTGDDPFQIRMERVLSPTKAIINGRETLLVGTNNYLGLTFDPSCMEAAIEAIRAEGTGTTGSRIANGSYAEHVALEKRARRVLRQEALHGLHDRLPGQPRHDLDAGRPGRLPADRRRQPRLDLRRLQA